MRSSRSVASLVVVGVLALGAGACGGKSKGVDTSGVDTGGGDPRAAAGDRLPWEAALTEGATFVLHNQLDDSEPRTVTVRVAAVETAGAARVYRLAWDEEGGPTTLRVEAGQVTINDAAPSAMKEPFTAADTGALCYGEDFSNPDGCDDVCDADLCLAPTGIVGVSMLYAPGYSIFAAR